MIPSQTARLNIAELIERQAIEVFFQPIVSIRRKTIIGVEALSRGVSENGRAIPPAQLFSTAKTAGLTPELDRLCRNKAVESFLPLHAANPELILFINVEPTTVHEISDGSKSLINLLRQKNLDPRNVAIEIVESEFENLTRLQKVIDRNKQQGFLTVLDDVGVGHSNLDRINKIKPDILKIDRSLVHNLHTDSHKQEVLKALVGLGERIGGWAIIEGVEQQEEAIYALDLGADMLQGFYLARPHRINSKGDIQLELERIQETAIGFKSYTLNKTREAQVQRQQRLDIVQKIAAQLQAVEVETFDRTLAELLNLYPAIESACVLNTSGIQIGTTTRSARKDEQQKTVIFKPPGEGSDHSLKEYYYLLTEAQIDPFETNPYVPLPSSNLCITVSTAFENVEQHRFILCLHIMLDSAQLGRPRTISGA